MRDRIESVCSDDHPEAPRVGTLAHARLVGAKSYPLEAAAKLRSWARKSSLLTQRVHFCRSFVCKEAACLT